VEQTFILSDDNKLIYERTGGCVGYSESAGGGFTNIPLYLTDCNADKGVGYFEIINGSFISLRVSHTSISESDPVFITPMSTVGKIACINSSVGLTDLDYIKSRIVLSEESVFQQDRKILRDAMIPRETDSCDFKACGFNNHIAPIRKLPEDKINICKKPWECVTLVVKTARRPHLVVRLAQSVRDSYGYDLPISCYDDGPDDYPQIIKDQLSQFPLLKYFISEDVDLGIAEGRNRALKTVETKYVFILDDDVLFMNTTDIRTMIDILDTTDAVLVGGRLVGRANFAALMKFGYYNGTLRRLGYFPGTCEKLNQTVPNFPQCFRCELNSNIWMARTESILKIGGWDPELKIVEHKDVFIRMKAAGLKLATCRGIFLLHKKPKEESEEQVEGYYEKRHRSIWRFRRLSNARYNIHDVFSYGGADVSENGDPILNNGPPPPPFSGC
jgi:GT2 family glycosyltransferase